MRVQKDIGFDVYETIEESLTEFKARLDALARHIGATPETAQITLEYDSDWRDGGGSIEAYVWRAETEAEAASRRAADDARSAHYAAQREASERTIYAALKAKFGDTV